MLMVYFTNIHIAAQQLFTVSIQNFEEIQCYFMEKETTRVLFCFQRLSFFVICCRCFVLRHLQMLHQ